MGSDRTIARGHGIDTIPALALCPACLKPLTEFRHREGSSWHCDTGHFFGSVGALLAAMTRAMYAAAPPRRVDAVLERLPA